MSNFLFSELEAHRLVYGGNLSSDIQSQIEKAVDYILMLAERIKNDRLKAAMR